MKKIIFILAIGMFMGLFTSWVTYEGLHRTADDKFCVLCHEMRPMVSAYHHDVHGGAGKSGIKVSCVKCHIPHDNIFNYIYTKARNGIVEGKIHFFGDLDAINWVAKRKGARAHYVFDQACKDCHTNYANSKYISKMGIKMHKHYASLLGTPKQIKCVQCHVGVGHNGLLNTLNYYKPEYEFYKGKFKKEKEALEKALDKELSREVK